MAMSAGSSPYDAPLPSVPSTLCLYSFTGGDELLRANAKKISTLTQTQIKKDSVKFIFNLRPKAVTKAEDIHFQNRRVMHISTMFSQACLPLAGYIAI